MQISLTAVNNQTPYFSGATKTLRHRYFKTEKTILDVFATYPNSDGIAGSLPYSWLKNIIHLPKEQKSPIIKNLLKLFRETFSVDYPKNMDRGQLSSLSQAFTKTLRNNGIIGEDNQIIIKQKNFDGAIMTNAFTIHERGKNKNLEPLFVKQFYNNSGRRSANVEGVCAELALGLHLNKIFHNEHIIKPYFGDTKAHFMVSKYEVTPQNVRIPRELTKAELFAPSRLQQYFEKLQTITNDNTNIPELLAKKGFEHHDLHDQNIIITKNKKGKLILKLIDLGKIQKMKNS